MKKIDGYIAVTFVGPFLLCLVGLVGLFVVIDFFANVDEFARESIIQTLRWAAVYYVLCIPWYLVQIMPVLTVLPAVICLLRLQRTNELCAIRAAGTSARRSAAPILVCSALVMVLAGLNQELLVPALREPLGLAERKAREADKPKVGLSHAVDKSGRFVLVGSYDEEQPLPTLSDVEIIQDDPEPGGARVVHAGRAFAPRRGDWDRWFLEDVEVEGGGAAGRPEPPRQFKSQAVATLIRAYRAGETGVLITADPGTGRAFQFGEYNEEGSRASFWPVARRVEVIDPTSREEGWLRIDRMVWVDDRWLMFGASRVRETDLAARRTPLEEFEDGTEFPGSLRPADIRSGEFQQASAMMSLRELAEWADTFPWRPRFQQRCWVTIWNRIAYPLANVILVLAALPLVFRRDSSAALVGVALAVLITVLYLGANIVSVDLAYRQTPIWRWPPFAGTFPTVLFGLAGGWLFSRMDRV